MFRRQVGHTVGGNLLPRHPLQRNDRCLVFLGVVDERRYAWDFTLDNRVAQQEGERLVTDVFAGVPDGVPQTVPLLLPDVVDVGEVGDPLDTVQPVALARYPEFLFEFV